MTSVKPILLKIERTEPSSYCRNLITLYDDMNAALDYIQSVIYEKEFHEFLKRIKNILTNEEIVSLFSFLLTNILHYNKITLGVTLIPICKNILNGSLSVNGNF